MWQKNCDFEWEHLCSALFLPERNWHLWRSSFPPFLGSWLLELSCAQEALIDLPHSRKPVSPLPSTCYHITLSSSHQSTESRMALVICLISFLWSSIEVQSETVSLSVVSDSLQLHGLSPTRLLCAGNSPDKNTTAGCHVLLQGIFLTQE